MRKPTSLSEVEKSDKVSLSHGRYKPYLKTFPQPYVGLSGGEKWSRSWPDKQIESAPIWCSVDLRDGNQALVNPMNVSQKLHLYKLLLEIGFKEIEIGFPSASQIEFDFTRKLIEEDLIPEGVTPQVLTQARAPLIQRTFESLVGAKRAIVHLYNSTSELQRRVVFKLGQKEIRQIAVDGALLVKKLAAECDSEIVFEYSPESFTGTELQYSLDVCEAVMDAWEPSPSRKMIINLPATVEMATPNVYADQIEWFSTHVKNRESIILSLHTHNDRGCAVAASELGLLAGAERIEGTLFGNGERTGNVDIVTLALNMHTQGVDPQLNLKDISKIREASEQCTELKVHERHPYAGELVFTAFSGSHQDAINKGFRALNDSGGALWEVPYLPIDPKDIGRSYEAIIRINSQSGKGGVAYIMQSEYGCDMPKDMHPEFSAVVQKLSEERSAELPPSAIWDAFSSEFFRTAPYKFLGFRSSPSSKDPNLVECVLSVEIKGEVQDLHGVGNGPIDAGKAALISSGCQEFAIKNFVEHARTSGSDAEAVAYIQIEVVKGGASKRCYGAGIHSSIEKASILAMLSALNRV